MYHCSYIFREENSQLKESLDEKTKGLDLCISENHLLKAELEDVKLKLKNAEAENKNLIDRWMLEKMKDAEKLNEVTFFCQNLGSKSSRLLHVSIACNFSIQISICIYYFKDTEIRVFVRTCKNIALMKSCVVLSMKTLRARA